MRARHARARYVCVAHAPRAHKRAARAIHARCAGAVRARGARGAASPAETATRAIPATRPLNTNGGAGRLRFACALAAAVLAAPDHLLQVA
eukprot:5856876-Prymnesium_polylepis.1